MSTSDEKTKTIKWVDIPYKLSNGGYIRRTREGELIPEDYFNHKYAVRGLDDDHPSVSFIDKNLHSYQITRNEDDVLTLIVDKKDDGNCEYFVITDLPKSVWLSVWST